MSTEPRRLLRPGQVSTALPREARALLRAAYETEPHLGLGASRARVSAIEVATRQVVAAYPHLFREDAVKKL